MLSLFPQLLDWSWYVPFIFRLFLGFYFFFIGYSFTRSSSAKNSQDGLAWLILGLLIIILSLGFFLGIYVQIVGVIGFVLSLLAIYFKHENASFTPESVGYYLLLGVVSLSLLFLGAGPHAFDLPL